MKRLFKIWLILAAGAMVVAAGPSGMSGALTELRLYLRKPSGNSPLPEFGRIYGDEGIDTLCELYGDGEWAGLPIEMKSQVISFVSLKNTAAVRGLMLRVEEEMPRVYCAYTVPHFAEHFGDYTEAERGRILVICRDLLRNPPALKNPPPGPVRADEMAARVMPLLGRYGGPGDIGLIQGAQAIKDTGDKAWMVEASRPALARLGDAKARAEILADLGSYDASEVARAIVDLEFVDDPKTVTALFPLLTDRRVVQDWKYAGEVPVKLATGAAMDFVAARAIFNLLRKKPAWKLTAPGGELKPVVEHLKSWSPGGASFKPVDVTLLTRELALPPTEEIELPLFAHLSEEQRAEVAQWAQGYGR